MMYSLMHFLLYSFSTALSFYVIEKIYNLIFKKEIIREGEKNSILDNNACKVKQRATLTHLPNKLLDPNFVEKFRKYSSEYCRINPDDFDKFGEYIASVLESLKSENNKEKLKNEIRNVIMEISE